MTKMSIESRTAGQLPKIREKRPLKKRAHIKTFGCQMNVHDSARMAQLLEREGYVFTARMERADLILVNTCSVRKNPENKVYSLLGRLAIQKRRNPNVVIGVAGCVAQREAENILHRCKAVDLAFGTDAIFRLPEMLRRVSQGERIVSTDRIPGEKRVRNFIPDRELETGTVDGCRGLIAISKGCDNFCSFCIVPTVRGGLVSREIGNIVLEAKDLIKKGAKEIRLLGQNVNSYKANGEDFYSLIDTLSDLKGLKRLRFTSPHPNDWDSSLTDLVAEKPVVCNQIHLPFQAGADRILDKMQRGHTAAEYIAKIDYLKRKIPDVTISTDIIVGFPGETEEEFEETLQVMRHVRFLPVYAFQYSPRPGTKAAGWEDDVPPVTKRKRLQRVLNLQKEIQDEILNAMVGTKQEILIDSAHPKERQTMNGRTGGNVPVSIADPELDIGDILSVKIVGKKTHSLIGESFKCQ